MLDRHAENAALGRGYKILKVVDECKYSVPIQTAIRKSGVELQ